MKLVWHSRYGQYPDRLLPISPRLFPIDFVALPFFYMLVYQYYHDGRGFIVANVILAAFLAFVLEPILVWLNLYLVTNWQHHYSFIIYILIAVVSRWLTNILVDQDSNYK